MDVLIFAYAEVGLACFGGRSFRRPLFFWVRVTKRRLICDGWWVQLAALPASQDEEKEGTCHLNYFSLQNMRLYRCCPLSIEILLEIAPCGLTNSHTKSAEGALKAPGAYEALQDCRLRELLRPEFAQNPSLRSSFTGPPVL